MEMEIEKLREKRNCMRYVLCLAIGGRRQDR